MLIMISVNIISVAWAKEGVIDNAPRVGSVLNETADFLLSVLGVLAILAVVVIGGLYLFSSGDESRMKTAKNAATYALIGAVVALGALVILRQVAVFFEQ